VNDLVCYAPETDIMAAQRADNARTDELFFAWLAQQRVAAGTHSEELSDTALVAEAQGFVQTNPTDTREKWLRNLTAQNLGSSVHQLQTACGVPGIGWKKKKGRAGWFVAMNGVISWSISRPKGLWMMMMARATRNM